MNLVCAHSCLMASATASGSMTSPSRTAPVGQGDLTELLEGDSPLPNDQLGRADARRPDVETDGGSSSHVDSPSRAAVRPRGLARLGHVSEGHRRRVDAPLEPPGDWARSGSAESCRGTSRRAAGPTGSRGGRPTSMNGPNGIFDLRPARPRAISAPPDDARRAGSPAKPPTTRTPQPSQPRYSPSTPASLTSPKPMPAG